MCKCKDIKKKGVKNGSKWFRNQNANAYYRFLGVHNFP